MDFATLAVSVLLAIGLLGVNAAFHANSVIVEVTAMPKSDRFIIDQTTLEQEFDDQLFAIAKIPSVVEPPEIHASDDQGLGMAIAKEARLQEVAYALQSALGFNPDRLRLALYMEDGTLHGVVSGSSQRVGTFRQVMVPQKDEPVLDFVRRCGLWGASQLAPYITALYLLQKHAPDKDFTDIVALIEHAKAKLPPTPISFDRAAFNNLLGIVALFRNDVKGAGALFEKAVAEYPSGLVAKLNAAFADLETDNYQKAVDRMATLISQSPPENKVLLATGYMTWAAAQMGLRDYQAADRLLAQAHQADPENSTALDLWAELKDKMGDKAAAADLHHRAMEATETFENYGEVAALYFKLSWQDNLPITRSKFINPSIVTFH